jgi:hypothetical protein
LGIKSEMPVEKDENWKFFRYRAVNEYLWQELELAELFACSPDKLNDPFDCQIDPLASLRRAIKDCENRERREVLHEILGEFETQDPREKDRGICCFSVSAESHLMWSHYADSHKGVCLLYDFPADYFPDKYRYERDDNLYFVGCAKVEYGDNDYYKWLTEGQLDDPIPDEPVACAAAKLFVTKAKCWSYEEEARIIVSEEAFLSYEKSFLKQVIFGLKTPKRQQDLIRSLLRKENPSVVFAQTIRDPNSDFGLVFQDE